MIWKKSSTSFEKIALPHLDAVFRAAVALCGRPSEAEDLVQVTFLKALEKFGSFKSGSNCRAWLLTILRNAWIDEIRRRSRRETPVSLDESWMEQAQTAEQTAWTNARDLLENFSDEDVIGALQKLPDDQRLTLFLIDVEQYSQEEVAEITDVAVGTVKSRTSRARNNLKEQLKQYASDKGYARGEI